MGGIKSVDILVQDLMVRLWGLFYQCAVSVLNISRGCVYGI